VIEDASGFDAIWNSKACSHRRENSYLYSATPKAYIDSLVEAQQNQDCSLFLALVLEAVERSLVETLTILATAQTSRGQNSPFYEAILAFLQNQA
jgi:hypothetical protein